MNRVKVFGYERTVDVERIINNYAVKNGLNPVQMYFLDNISLYVVVIFEPLKDSE